MTKDERHHQFDDQRRMKLIVGRRMVAETVRAEFARGEIEAGAPARHVGEQRRGRDGAQDLSGNVRQQIANGETVGDRESNRHSRIEVRAGQAPSA